MTVNNQNRMGVSKVSSMVNDLIANQGVLYVKLHQYHWYVKGPHFFTLHDKFEELYNETSSSFDLFAERLIAKGDKPLSTLSEYLDHATIAEKTYEGLSEEEMVHDTINDYHILEGITLDAIKQAGEEKDFVTEDMLVGYMEEIHKTIWMLQAFLGNDARDGLEWTENARLKIKINREEEMRTEEISQMIGEGGLGAEKYYHIKKV